MTLETLRNEIDSIDDQMRGLFEKRMEAVRRVAEVKREQKTPLLNSAREREIIARLTADQDEEIAGYLKMLYTTIFDVSRAYQAGLLSRESQIAARIETALQNTPPLFPKQAMVACQGTEGANSAAACEKMIARPSITYLSTFEGVFTAVEKGLCRYGILPLENSLHGSVTSIYDLMKKHNFHIVRSVKLKINHALLAKPGVAMGDIKIVYSHEQALHQCSEFIKSIGAKAVPCENTAVAAQMVAASEDKSVAAISAPGCAGLNNLEILAEGVQNSDNNYTRFICIAKSLEIYPGAHKVSLMMTLTHKPGALYHLVAKFAALGINLTKLESRPIAGSDFEFMFYFDLDVSVYDRAIYNLFSQLEADSEKFVFLGCYSEG